MYTYLPCQLFDFICQVGIAFPEHVPDTGEIVLIADQGLIVFQLFRRKPLDDIAAKGRVPTIFRKGYPGTFRPFYEQLLFIDGTPEFDIGPFHFISSLRPSGVKQVCFCGNKNTS